MKITLLFMIQSIPGLSNPYRSTMCLWMQYHVDFSRVKKIFLSISFIHSLSLIQACREWSARGGYRRLGDAWRSQHSLLCIDRSVNWRPPVVGEKFGYVNLVLLVPFIPLSFPLFNSRVVHIKSKKLYKVRQLDYNLLYREITFHFFPVRRDCGRS